MNVERIHDEGQTLSIPTGKVLGVVDTQARFDRLAKALESGGFPKIQSLSGEEGVHLLERVHTLFFSDMEERVLARHIEELKAGHMIILVETPSGRVDELVEIATQNGARRLVHFGRLAVSWLTK